MTDKSGTKRVVLATRNLHKAREIRRILDSLPLTVLDLKDFPQIPKIAEPAALSGKTPLSRPARFLTIPACGRWGMIPGWKWQR